MAIRLI